MNPTSLNNGCLPRSVRYKLISRGPAIHVCRWQRPLGDLNTAMRDLDLSGEEVRQLTEQRMLIGFNIAVQTSGRGEPRILTRSLEHFRQTRGRTTLQLSWPEIFKIVFPGPKRSGDPGSDLPDTLTGLELNHGLNCSRAHVENLSRHHFQIVIHARAGRGHTPRFKTASVERWLKSRML
jgi:hypothetical protein